MTQDVLIQKDDVKSRQWQEAAAELGFSVRIMPGSGAFVSVRLFSHLIRKGRPSALIFRYLNDYPSLGKTLLRLLSEVSALAMAWMLGIRLLWVCHNVDKESDTHHPLLSYIRRHLLARLADAILVTDPLLVPYAQEVFPKHKAKITYTVFGAIRGLAVDGITDRGVLKRIREFSLAARQGAEQTGTRLRIGLCAGTPHVKKPQFQDIPRLLDAAARANWELRMVVLGPVGRFLALHNPEVWRTLQSSDKVLVINDLVPVDEGELAPYVDFSWRVLTDLSVPLGLYTAATAGKPILTRRTGFLSEAVEAYDLGAVMKEDMSDVGYALKKLDAWNERRARDFLTTHSWYEGARRLARAGRISIRS